MTLSETEAESIAAGGSLTIDSSSGPVSLALELIPDVDDDEDEAGSVCLCSLFLV